MKLLYALGLAAMLTLGGCSSLRTAINAVNIAADATIPPNVAVAAANGFDAIEFTGANILAACTLTKSHTPPSVCVAQAANIRTMSKAIIAGRTIRNSIEPKPDVTLPISGSAYTNLQNDISIITNAVAAFNSASGN